MATNNSSKYKHITSKVLIHSGSPSVYQLTPKKETAGSLRRMTLGVKDPAKSNKTMLLVGETGSGKSTLVNALVNYAMGVTWEDDVWFQITEDEKNQSSQSESQTSDVIVYQIFGFEGKTLPYSLTIIDTTGYGDTRGIECDAIISERLFDSFRADDGVHEINAVGLVLKATENRLSDRLRYIFDSVVSLFGKDMEKNIVALITHSNGLTPKNALKALDAAKIKCARNEKNQPFHFLFNNCQHEDRTEDTEDLEHADKIATKGMSQFTNFLSKTEAQKLKIIVDVMTERIRLTACIQNLQERVEWIKLKQTEIQQTQEALKKYEQEVKNNEKFTVEVDEAYKVKENIKGGLWGLLFYKGATCCKICEENCHYPGCTIAWYPRNCKVMKGGRCTSCTKRCPVSDHVKENWIYVSKTRKVQMTLQDVKGRYDENKAGSENQQSLLKNLEKKMEELQKDKDQWLENSFKHVDRLEQIALNVDSLSTYVHLDFLIEKMEEKGETEKVQKLEEMKSRANKNKGIGARGRYMFGQLKAAGNAIKPKLKNNSSKYDHITSKVLIQSGSPAVYQLTPKKENIGSLRRMTLGVKDPAKSNKTILLVGETGSGKSTLINALVNYAMGVKWEDDVWFQIIEDEKNQSSQSESQTSDVIVYQIFGFEGKTLPYSLTIIDTPGYGDTRGIECDAIVSQRLFDWFRSDDGVHEINAVGLVLKASENRLSDRLRYIFDSVVSLFGKDMEKNIVALITHSNGLTPRNALKALDAAKIKCARNEKNQPLHFLFDNCQHEDRTEDAEKLEDADKISTKGMSQFTDFLSKTEAQKLKITVDVMTERIRLTACIQNLQERVEWIELKQTEIQQTQEALKKYEQEVKNNEKFTVEVDEAHKVKENIKGGKWGLFYEGATCCKICEENCHHPGCTIAWYPRDCEVMSGGRCTSCTNRCPVSDHVKENWIYVSKTRKVQMTNEEIKKKYEKNKAGSESQQSLLENLEKKMEELQRDKDRWLEDSFKHVDRLEQIALNVDSLSTYVHLDFLIEKMKEKGETEKVQKLEEMKSRADEDKGIGATVRYMFGQVKAAGKAMKAKLK